MMGSLTRVFGDTPRINAMEALLDLWNLEFTRNQLGEQAGLVPDSRYAAAEELENDGYIEVVEDGEYPLYRVNTENPYLHIVAHASDALERVKRRRHVEGFKMEDEWKTVNQTKAIFHGVLDDRQLIWSSSPETNEPTEDAAVQTILSQQKRIRVPAGHR